MKIIFLSWVIPRGHLFIKTLLVVTLRNWVNLPQVCFNFTLDFLRWIGCFGFEEVHIQLFFWKFSHQHFHFMKFQYMLTIIPNHHLDMFYPFIHEISFTIIKLLINTFLHNSWGCDIWELFYYLIQGILISLYLICFMYLCIISYFLISVFSSPY